MVAASHKFRPEYKTGRRKSLELCPVSSGAITDKRRAGVSSPRGVLPLAKRSAHQHFRPPFPFFGADMRASYFLSTPARVGATFSTERPIT